MIRVGANRYQSVLLVVFVLAAVATSLSPVYPDQLLLQHVPTALALALLVGSARRFPLGDASFTALIAFLSLHLVGARWIYSFVPYDEWTDALLGFELSDVFGWERNHYDRLVHFSFGLLVAVPTEEIVRRLLRPRPGWSYYVAVEFVIAWSVVYELVEWGIALVFAPEWADRYLGQQGDVWDAHKDMALAAVGALIAMATLAMVRRARSAEPVLRAG